MSIIDDDENEVLRAALVESASSSSFSEDESAASEASEIAVFNTKSGSVECAVVKVGIDKASNVTLDIVSNLSVSNDDEWFARFSNVLSFDGKDDITSVVKSPSIAS